MGRSERELRCEEVPALVRRFLSSGAARRLGARLRAHVDGCRECRAHYHEAVRAAAHIGHERRAERVAVERATRRWSLRRDVLSAHARPRGRGARLRTLLYPAFFCYLMVQLGGPHPGRGGLTLAAIEGTVHAGPTVRAGEWCGTSADGRARLEAPRGVALLGRDTRVLLERESPPRLRLVAGSLELEGSWRVVSELGVLELEGGRAWVGLSADGLRCEARAGSLRFVGVDGEQRLARGESLAVEGFGGPADGRPTPRGSASGSAGTEH